MTLVPPEYLSPSSISTFLQCPLKFKLSRIDGIREPPTEATLLGNLVHSVLEELYRLPSRERSVQQARALARQLWDSDYAEEVSRIVPSGKLNDFRWKAWFCIENLWRIEDPENFQPTGIEYEINTTINNVAIKGFVDRYKISENGEVTISDYKTGKVPSPKWAKDKFFQLLIYAVSLETLNVGKVENLELIFLKGPKVFSEKVTSQNLENTITTITQVKNAIDERCDKKFFETKTSKLCDWCYFKGECPAWRRK